MPRNFFLKNLSEITTRTRGYIPHWELRGAAYSVTIRLHGSLPREVIARLHEERIRNERAITGGVRPMTGVEDTTLRAHMESRYDEALHTDQSVAFLSDSSVAELVARTLDFFHGERYRLYAWAIMPNHVHIVVAPIEPHTLATILHSWKSYSSNRANEILGRTGPFWHREYYDRIVRDERDLANTIDYVLANPRKAGLKNWRWTSAGWKPA
jgi:REP element-mobilizing transposase RayT